MVHQPSKRFREGGRRQEIMQCGFIVYFIPSPFFRPSERCQLTKLSLSDVGEIN